MARRQGSAGGGKQEKRQEQGRRSTTGGGTSRSTPDRERRVETTRETASGMDGGTDVTGAGAQRAAMTPRGTREGMTPSRESRVSGPVQGGVGQPSLLPAFMANPGLMASAFMRDPFAFAEVMSDEMERLFSSVGYGDVGGRGLQAPRGGAQPARQQGGMLRGGWTPQVEIFQRGEELVVRADLPGVKVDDVSLDVENGTLVITGERRAEHEDRGEGFFRSERRYGSFTRAIALPDGVDEERIDATFRDGVLEVTVPLPRAQEQRGRRIQVRSGGVREGSAGGGANRGGNVSDRDARAIPRERDERPGPDDPGTGRVGA